MEYDSSTFETLAELTLAFIAFVAIVASLRVTSGEALTPFEILVVKFFVESGLLLFTVAVLPIVLLQFSSDTAYVATATTWYAFLAVVAYLSFYFWRRRSVAGAPVNLLLSIVSLGWLVCAMALGISLTGAFFQPSMALLAALLIWGFCSSSLVFTSFLTRFLEGRH